MIFAEGPSEVREHVANWRRAGLSIAFVPTMGNLHEGHLALVELARRQADRVVVSIYVNPLQFGPGEDFEAYPRTLDADQGKLTVAAADLLIVPRTTDIYPEGAERHTFVEVPGLSDDLCGHHRPGHFRGVTTIVCKLLNWVQPDVLILGEKDYQQLVIIRRMVADLAIPVTVIGGATVREPAGLALSSRNAYLTPDERAQATELSRALTEGSTALLRGVGDFSRIEAECGARLSRSGFRVDYVSVRRATDLSVPTPTDRSLVILAAAWLGRTRLIDNRRVDLAPSACQQ
ncbi:pantoate--beta-alanine ligase [Methylotetracoccus oryzae]|uniref:pantoate--beta-alanine ligase n=1 Tax=Methylotetracoccus oryzae TaxID=1919059 RepID=UPI00111B8949|nr:pantoate--beta-alanine ligase [Methylotetracoccus oryzae]